MTTEYIGGLHAVEAALKSSAAEVDQVLVLQGRRDQRIRQIIRLAERHTINIQIATRSELDKLVPNTQHQGVAAVIRSSVNAVKTDIVSFLKSVQMKSPGRSLLVLALDEIQDPHNLGACLRTADAVGVDAVVIPGKNSVGLTPVVRKVASGAVESVPFFQVSNLQRTLKSLQDLGFWVYGAAGEASECLYQLTLTDSVVIVVGAEGSGLRRLTRERCDSLFHLPMRGSVSSLNVSVATGVALYEVLRQRSD